MNTPTNTTTEQEQNATTESATETAKVERPFANQYIIEILNAERGEFVISGIPDYITTDEQLQEYVYIFTDANFETGNSQTYILTPEERDETPNKCIGVISAAYNGYEGTINHLACALRDRMFSINFGCIGPLPKSASIPGACAICRVARDTGKAIGGLTAEEAKMYIWRLFNLLEPTPKTNSK